MERIRPTVTLQLSADVPSYLTKEPYDPNPKVELRHHAIIEMNRQWFVVNLDPTAPLEEAASQWTDVLYHKLHMVSGPFAQEKDAALKAYRIEMDAFWQSQERR